MTDASPQVVCEHWKSLGWNKVKIVAKMKFTKNVNILIQSASKVGIASSYSNNLIPTIPKTWTNTYLHDSEKHFEDLNEILMGHLHPYTLMANVHSVEKFSQLVMSSNASTAIYALANENLYIIHTNKKWQMPIINKVTTNKNRALEQFNFQGMPISSITLSWQAWFQIDECNFEGKECSTKGILADFMNILKEMYNFTWYSDKDVNENWGYFSNEMSTQTNDTSVLRSVISRDYDLSLSNWNHFLERDEILDTTIGIADLKSALYIGDNSRGIDTYMLMRPFTLTSWAAVISTTMILIAVTLISYKSGEFKMTHQATANRFSLFSRLAPVVSRILR